MKIILHDNRRYVIRFDKGEELVGKLIDFCDRERIETAYFWGLGAIEEVVISHYDIDTKKYSDKEFKEKLEIVNLLGNIAKMPARNASRSDAGGSEKTIIHAHGSFSNPEMEMVGGHIKKLIVGPTCEIFLIKLEGKIEREYSDEIGLNLMSPHT